MTRKIMYLSFGLFLVYFFGGCTTGGSFLSSNVTSVELSEPNFNIVAKNIQGKSRASYIIGATFSAGSIANTLALVRVGGSAKLYDDAIKDLWKNFEAEYGETKGKNLVLANIRIDNDMLNFILYTQTDLFITADVVEFIEE
jgi:hypothetical protein